MKPRKKNKTPVKDKKTIEQVVEMAINCHQLGRLSEAEALYQHILRSQSDNIDALHLSGVLCTQTGRHDEAIDLIKKAIAINPHISAFHSHLGNAYQNAEQYDEAIASYKTALQLEPNSVDIYTNLGALFHKLENYTEAATYYLHALRFNPQAAEFYNNLAIVLSEEKRYEEAEIYFRKAIQINPSLASAYTGLGNVLLDIYQYKQAIPYYRQALQLDSKLYRAYTGLGRAIYHYDPEVGLNYFQKSLALNPYSSSTHLARSSTLLTLQRFVSDAWYGYKARPSRRRLLTKIPNLLKEIEYLPLDLTGKRFLLCKEQGLGDELLFLRFVPLLKQRGAWVAYQCSGKLYSLLRGQTCIDLLLKENDELPTVDTTLLIGDLPYVLNTAEFIPASLSLQPLPEQIDKMKQRLISIGAPPYIGLTWRGGITSQESRWTRRVLQKEIELTALANALNTMDVTFIALQRNPYPDEINQFSQLLGKTVHDFSEINDDLEEALALLYLLDDYIGVSNTNIHLMAGLGKTAQVLIPYPPDWRWTLSTEESPWFKGFKTYRQTREQDWSICLNDLKNQLSS